MTDAEYKRFFNRALWFAYTILKNKALAEDVASHVILSWIEYEKKHGTHPTQTVSQAVIDAIRTQFGNANRNIKRSDFKKDTMGLKKPIIDVVELQLKENASMYSQIFPYLPANVKTFDRAIFILYFKWGFELKEIGEMFGLSESRISQMLTKLCKRVKKEYFSHV